MILKNQTRLSKSDKFICIFIYCICGKQGLSSCPNLLYRVGGAEAFHAVVRIHLKQKMLVRIHRTLTFICELLCFPTASSVFLILIRNAKSALFESIQIYFKDGHQFMPTMEPQILVASHSITIFTTVVKQITTIIK